MRVHKTLFADIKWEKKNMITKEELKELLHSTETYRVERTTSTSDMDKFQEAICAFSNDLPNSRKNGYLILGAYDNGTLSGLKVTDDLPLRIYEFARHLEITNAGGLYGNARPENSPMINDYRNPLVASAMKTLGYVNMFNRGVGQVQTDLKENGNPPAEFVVNLITAFKVNVTDVINTNLFPAGGKLATPTPKVASSSQKVATFKKNKSAEEMAIYILEYCETWRSIGEIAQFAERDKNYIRNKVLPRLSEKLEKEFPDVPKHPKQRYRVKPKEADQ